jgi:hypothetical protein
MDLSLFETIFFRIQEAGFANPDAHFRQQCFRPPRLWQAIVPRVIGRKVNIRKGHVCEYRDMTRPPASRPRIRGIIRFQSRLSAIQGTRYHYRATPWLLHGAFAPSRLSLAPNIMQSIQTKQVT